MTIRLKPGYCKCARPSDPKLLAEGSTWCGARNCYIDVTGLSLKERARMFPDAYEDDGVEERASD